MGTEEDRPNNGVLITIFVMGGAAMLGGSAAIVGMTRTEMEAQSFEMSGYADLDTVRELRDAQQKTLRESKLPIDHARDQLLVDIQRNPRNASFATPLPTVSATAAGGAPAAATGSASAGAGGAAGAATAEGASGLPVVAGGASGTEPAPEALPHVEDDVETPTPRPLAPRPRASSAPPAPPSPAPPPPPAASGN